jgi:uncharacterized protein (DUF1800 family)
MPLVPYTGPFGKPELLHLLRRAFFGVNKADLAYFSNKSLQQVVNILLTPPALQPNPPLADYTGDPAIAVGTTWVNGPSNNNYQTQRGSSLKAWWISQMLTPGVSIREKMVLFLHNHAPTTIGGAVNEAIFAYRYNVLLRTHALGNFKSFIRALTIDPAMLYYLNGRSNFKNAPNENYARELQELFTIGKDLSAHFTESDVQQAARVLTGWRVNTTTLQTYFDPNVHDTGNKTFSSFYNNTDIQGKMGPTAGDQELDALLNMIFAHPEVARYLVRKIYRFFVYYDIDSNIENNVIVPLADIFRNGNYEMAPVLQALFTSQHFFDQIESKGCMLRNPLEFCVGIGRIFGLTGLAGDTTGLYRNYRFFRDNASQQTMDIGAPPDVSGWPPYYQKPNYHELWINADTLRKRKEFIDRIIISGSNGMKADIILFTAGLSNPADPNALIAEVLELVHTLPSDPTVIASLKSILLSNQASDAYWTIAWNTYQNNPNTTNLNIVRTRLQTFYQAVLGMAEYNLI